MSYYSNDFTCPYCGHEFDDEDGELDYNDGATNFIVCPECEKEFIAYTNVSISYDCVECPCHNGGEHEWEPTHTAPRHFTRMCCKFCGEEREPTEEERIKYNIPPKEEYFKQLNEKKK